MAVIARLTKQTDLRLYVEDKILNDIVARVFTPFGYAGADAIAPRMSMLEMLGVGSSKGVGNVSVVDEVTRRANIAAKYRLQSWPRVRDRNQESAKRTHARQRWGSSIGR